MERQVNRVLLVPKMTLTRSTSAAFALAFLVFPSISAPSGKTNNMQTQPYRLTKQEVNKLETHK